jgi:hypothetical protein
MWTRLKKNHPELYEMVQWGMVIISLAAIAISVTVIATR